MWQTDWATQSGPVTRDNAVRENSTINSGDIENVYLLHWCEHCVECAVPDCYRTCPLYVRRADQKCARFRYGIGKNRHYRGLYDYGADIYYRRWGKLESDLRFGVVSVSSARWLDRLDRLLLGVINPIANGIRMLNKYRRLNGAYHFFRKKLLRLLSSKVDTSSTPDEFIIEAWNPSKETIQVVLECYQEEIRFRHNLNLTPGSNVHRVPFDSMNLDLNAGRGRILLYPDNDRECRVIFTWLDFVRYKRDPHTGSQDHTYKSRETKSGIQLDKKPKIKCVVWDLDNTLWHGVLVEDGPDGIRPDERALKLIKELDSRGIVQSIASKNDFALAWGEITKLGLEEYFLYPAIHWGPKSDSVRQIVNELNIGADAVALIDDSAFERAEVTKVMPQVRAYFEENLLLLLERSEFDVLVTEESKRRRLTYMVDAKRKQVAQSFGNNYEEFLKSCAMQQSLFVPSGADEVQRCLELIQRTNQLNLSTHRYSADEFSDLLNNNSVLSVSARLKDNFGDYGIIGFASIDFSGDVPLLRDFVFSCRAAKRKVENAWMDWMRGQLLSAGHKYLQARFIPSSRNGVLRDVLAEIGFTILDEGEDSQLLQLDLENAIPAASIVFITDAQVANRVSRLKIL